MIDIGKRYNPLEIEDKIYKLWKESGYFNPDKLPRSYKKPFTIIMPPPNANGSLHIGHALFVSLQDLMIRFWRMKGRRALWLPGADHAGFETQVVFDKKLEKEGRSRFGIPRDRLYAEMLDFTLKNKAVMERQLRKLGASCDWSREKFTLDPDIIEEVQRTFIKMYEDGLIYRGTRLVNWCVKHQTTLSDLEVKYAERKDPLYYIKYGPLVLATVRPETKFGDTALAVNPKDKRYQKYIGKEIEVEGLLGKLRFKVIADEAVDPKFGTGVIKVTPAHDPADFEIGLRHNLKVIAVIDKFGRLNEKTGPFKGLKVLEARPKVAEAMKQKGLLEKVDENYVHNVAACYKCGQVIEPMVLPQWFVKMKPLAEKAIRAVEKGEIRLIPKRFEKTYFHWLKNIRDWNISRQIPWGIRIPAWFRTAANRDEICVGMEKPEDNDWKQDGDVLDTWFSSGQWPYLVLGFKSQNKVISKSKFQNPKTRNDFQTYYPTDVMETGWDILFFWVARMIMLGLYRTGKIPFKTVYLNGLVRDKDRQKMSKSKGNVIDPLGVAETYGTDAVRMSLIMGATAGRDPIVSEDKIRGYRNFATKVWNAARFILLNYDERFGSASWRIRPKFSAKDKKLIKDAEKMAGETARKIEKFDFYNAGLKIYHYFWHTFADKIIEGNKERLRSEDVKERAAAWFLLKEILLLCLKTLHPFMPFITEAIYQEIPDKKAEMLMIEEIK